MRRDVVILSVVLAAFTAGAVRAEDAAPVERVTRRDLALALQQLERAWRERPATDAARRRRVASAVSSSTMAFFVGQGAKAIDGLVGARLELEGAAEPDPRAVALGRLRLQVPPVLVRGGPDASASTVARLVALGPPPDLGPVELELSWTTATPAPKAERAAALAGLSLPAFESRTTGRHRLVVRARAPREGVTATWVGETVVVAHDTDARLAACAAALERLVVPAGSPAGVQPTLLHLVARSRAALRGEVGEVLVAVDDELARVERALAAIRDAAAAGRPYRPTRADLAGDHHRATASGKTYRLYAPPPAVGPDGRPVERPVPVVLALHGLGGTEDMFAEAYGDGEALRLATERGWALVAPQDVRAGRDVLDDVASLLPVDAARVHGVGHSMGAAALWDVAMAAPDRFASIAPIAGGRMSFGAPTWSALTGTAVLAVTADQDFGRAATLRTAETARAAGLAVETRVLPDLDHLLVVGEAMPLVFAFFDAHRR